MSRGNVLTVAASTAFGVLAGTLMGGWVSSGVVGICSLGVSAVAVRARVRHAIVLTVVVGTLAGGMIGMSVTEAICLPESCRGLSITAGVVLAAVSFVGVGLVAALLARSFDEYNEKSPESPA